MSAEQRRVLSCVCASECVYVCVFGETLSGDCVDRNKALSAVSVLLRPLSLTGTITAVETQARNRLTRLLSGETAPVSSFLHGKSSMKNIVLFLQSKVWLGSKEGHLFVQSDRLKLENVLKQVFQRDVDLSQVRALTSVCGPTI